MSETGTAESVPGQPLQVGQIVRGPLFNEPMRVETVRNNGSGIWEVGFSGFHTECFRRVTLTADDIKQLQIVPPAFSYQGDGQLLRVGMQAYSLAIAYEFDPYFG